MTPRSAIRLSAIQQEVAEAFDIPADALVRPRPGERNRRRHVRPNRRAVSRARQAAMYLARKLNDRKDERFSLASIGHFYGGRDHTTVLYGIRQIEERRTREPDLAGRLEEIEWRLLA